MNREGRIKYENSSSILQWPAGRLSLWKFSPFLIFELENMKVNFLEIRSTGPEKHKNHDDRFNIIYKLLKDCQMIICSKIGKEPFIKLKKSGINILEYEGDFESAILKAASFAK